MIVADKELDDETRALLSVSRIAFGP